MGVLWGFGGGWGGEMAAEVYLRSGRVAFWWLYVADGGFWGGMTAEDAHIHGLLVTPFSSVYLAAAGLAVSISRELGADLSIACAQRGRARLEGGHGLESQLLSVYTVVVHKNIPLHTGTAP